MTSSSLIGDSFFGIDLRKLMERFQGLRRHVSKRVLLIEFDVGGLRIAEARFSGSGLQFDHVTRFQLPQEALERGVPADPEKMGALIKQLCREKQISVHRSAVVLPTEVAFQHLVQLPSGLSLDEARVQLLDSSSGLQIPISLAQADFDLQLTQLPSIQSEDNLSLQSYLITAIPNNLVDRVVETLQVAGLELQFLDIGGHSQLRLMARDLLELRSHEVRLLLELQPECTQFCLVGASGPLRFERLAAIREFPMPVLSDEQIESALEDGLRAETISINGENYLELSELDLQVLVPEVLAALNRFSSEWSGFHLIDIVLTGCNSAHPLLPSLLTEAFGCHTHSLEPLLASGIEGVQFDSFVIQRSLNRLLGLGLGLLPPEHLLSSPLPVVALPKESAIPLVQVSLTEDERYLRADFNMEVTSGVTQPLDEDVSSQDLSHATLITLKTELQTIPAFPLAEEVEDPSPLAQPADLLDKVSPAQPSEDEQFDRIQQPNVNQFNPALELPEQAEVDTSVIASPEDQPIEKPESWPSIYADESEEPQLDLSMPSSLAEMGEQQWPTVRASQDASSEEDVCEKSSVASNDFKIINKSVDDDQIPTDLSAPLDSLLGDLKFVDED